MFLQLLLKSYMDRVAKEMNIALSKKKNGEREIH